MDVIDEFLETWKTKSREYYDNIRAGYFEIVNTKDEDLKPLTNSEIYVYNHNCGIYSETKTPSTLRYYKEKVYLASNLGKNHTLKSYVGHYTFSYYDEYISKLINREAERKRAAFDAKINKKVGKVKSAHLTIGMDGEINGFVEGEKGKISVTTIGAGGYNIQRYHYRVLIKEIKD